MSSSPARETWIRSLWQLEVREGVFIHPTADVVQEMGNKGYDIAAIEPLVSKGHQLYKEDCLQDLLLLDLGHQPPSPAVSAHPSRAPRHPQNP